MQARKMTVLGLAVLLLFAGIAQANVLNMGGTRDAQGHWTGLASLETVHVDNAGNAGEWSGHSSGGYGPDRICGAVSYEYNIGKYEVTAGQYTEFLNKVAKTDAYGLYDIGMLNDGGCKIARSGSSGSYTYSIASDYANRPVSCVSYWDACRFANWLSNGQPTGAQDANTTERGTYTLDGYNGTDGRTIQRNPNSTWAVTSEDEWYKAAYYGPTLNSGSGGYWDYPTKSNTLPGQDMADASGNNANYYTAPYVNPIESGLYNTTVVGEFQNSASPYGTFDQGGNVFEWNESVVYQGSTYAGRSVRGGSWMANLDNELAAASHFGADPSDEGGFIGFRIVEVPEPATLSLLALGGLAILRRRK